MCVTEIVYMRLLPRWQRLTVQYSHAQLIRNTLSPGLHARLYYWNYTHKHARKKTLNVHTCSHKSKHTSIHTLACLQTKARTQRTAARTNTDPHELIKAPITLARISSHARARPVYFNMQSSEKWVEPRLLVWEQSSVASFFSALPELSGSDVRTGDGPWLSSSNTNLNSNSPSSQPAPGAAPIAHRQIRTGSS